MGCVWTQLQVVVDNGSLAKEHYFAPWLRGVVVAKREKQPLWARSHLVVTCTREIGESTSCTRIYTLWALL